VGTRGGEAPAMTRHSPPYALQPATEDHPPQPAPEPLGTAPRPPEPPNSGGCMSAPSGGGVCLPESRLAIKYCQRRRADSVQPPAARARIPSEIIMIARTHDAARVFLQ
jgi:hypothetical protein